MQVKKFEAKNMKEALTMIKAELGPEAIILNAKEYKGGFGLSGRSSVEVTAAVSEQTLMRKKMAEQKLDATRLEQFRGASAHSQKQFINKVFDPITGTPQERRSITQMRYVDIDEDEEHSLANQQIKARQISTQTQATTRSPYRQPQIAAAPTAPERVLNYAQMKRSVGRGLGAFFDHEPQQRAMVATQGSLPSMANEGLSLRVSEAVGEAARIFNEKINDAQVSTAVSTQTMTRDSLQAIPLMAAENNEVIELKKQINELKSIISSFQKIPQNFITQHPGAGDGVPYELSFMYEKLTNVGVSRDNAVEMINKAKENMAPGHLRKPAFVDAWVARYVLDTTKVTNPINPQKYQVFIGTGGQGKSSTLVKWASYLSIKKKKKIAILTTDRFRVGAAEQLRIFAQILNVPFAVIQRPSDWQLAEKRLVDFDYVLIDTPGFQLKSDQENAEMAQMLPPAQYGRCMHYVQSTLARDDAAFEIAARYCRYGIDDVIFTNIDETTQHGIILNFQKKFRVPLHSFGMGPNIPEDIEVATKERVVDLLFKLTSIRKES